MPSTKRKLLTIASAIALSVGVTSCASETGSVPVPASDATPETGGSATIVLGVEAVRGLDPAQLFNLTPSGDANRMSAIFGQLLSADASTGDVEPGLADSMVSSPDGNSWTLTLRPDLEFSDGTPLDAAAVVYNYDRILDPNTRSPLLRLLEGIDFEAVDTRTVQFTLPQPNKNFDQIVATNLSYVGSPTAIAQGPERFANNPVGAGPFVLREWKRDDRMTLARNDNFHDPSRPYLNEVVFLVVADPVQRVNLVASGQAQAAVPGSDLSYRKRAAQSRLSVTEAPAGGGPMFVFNTQQGPFADVRARRAMALALDMQDLASVIDPGSAAPVGLYGSASAYNTGGNAPLIPQDKERAQVLFDELAAESGPLAFTITTAQSGLFRRTAEYLESRLGTFDNVSVDIDIVDNATMDQRVFRNRDYDVTAQIVPIAAPEPNLYNLLYTGGQTNYSGMSDPALDTALDDARSASDQAARLDAYTRVEDIVRDQVPVLPFREQTAYTVHRPQLAGLELRGDGTLLYENIGYAPS
ncbi:hypothetical protein CH267_15790 [Rhodococcus sp. 06-621-2]|nr:ABC transporter substrate-binding protein [Rhodococcus sp. 06-621-2]OZC53665.1 hypothetical protein CH267_15790 [Rhodococcus sp. 06-621-2]